MSVFIIAEAGVNHNGQVSMAKRMIKAAYEAGCDAIKFQTFRTDDLVTVFADRAKYQKIHSKIESQYEMLKKLELTLDEHMELFNYCKSIGIKYMSSPFDEKSADFLDELGMKVFKIPSGEITNKFLLKHIAKKNKPIILSTGMSNLGEIEEAIRWIEEEGNNKITLLHCTSNYPTKVEDVNLKAMLTIKEAFKMNVGYSDHTRGLEICVAAVALGATVIEKHFTLSHELEGPDHKASIEVGELHQLVQMVRNVEKGLGDGKKRLMTNEVDVLKAARRSIVAKKRICQGETIQLDTIAIKRPGTGLSPKLADQIIGKKVKKTIEKDELINIDDIIW